MSVRSTVEKSQSSERREDVEKGISEMTLSYLGTEESMEDYDSDVEDREMMASSPKNVNLGMLRKMLTKGVNAEMQLPQRIVE